MGIYTLVYQLVVRASADRIPAPYTISAPHKKQFKPHRVAVASSGLKLTAEVGCSRESLLVHVLIWNSPPTRRRSLPKSQILSQTTPGGNLREVQGPQR